MKDRSATVANNYPVAVACRAWYYGRLMLSEAVYSNQCCVMLPLDCCPSRPSLWNTIVECCNNTKNSIAAKRQGASIHGGRGEKREGAEIQGN